MRRLELALIAIGTLAAPALADVLRVPQDFPTIQAAVDAAFSGDKIVVRRGTYTENVTINAKPNLYLRGKGLVTLNPPAGTGVVVTNSANVRIVGISTVTPAAFGIGFTNSPDGYVFKCRAQGLGGVGAINSGGFSVLSCQVSSTTLGIWFAGTGTYTAERCKVASSATGQAIAVGGDTANLIRCKVDYTGVPTKSPVLLASNVRGYAERCRIRTAPAGANVFGFDLQPAAPAAQFELVRNRIEGCNVGIGGTSVNNVTCVGNIMSAATAGGIGLVGVSFTIDRNKILLGAGSFAGIVVGSTTNTMITRNTVVGTGAGIFMLTSNGNHISGNKLKNLTVGVTLSGNANTIGPKNKYKNVTTPINDAGTNTIILDTP